ncbi:MAG: T9SS type A sorting domain-containing protein [Bacteroidia bacterium]|nr:T9SS type A sorting domain-containing protein [Bacteroidia bacterium]
MRTQHMKAAYAAALLISYSASAQQLLYKETHKEVSYDYAVIDSGTFEELSETEKIKYELRYSEKSVTKKILPDNSSYSEIYFDSNGYTKDWLKLPKRIVYDNDGMHLYNIQNELMTTLTYTDIQLTDRANDKIDVGDQGYHPGFVSFPAGNQQLFTQLANAGVQYQDYGNGKFSTTVENEKTIYDKQNLLIVTERVNSLGQKCKDYEGYVLMEDGKGYLPLISKTETSVRTAKGVCLTEVKLVYYTDYKIEDPGGVFEKALIKGRPIETVNVYPNPNNGLFSAEFVLRDDSRIQQIQLVNTISGEVINIEASDLNNGVLQINAADIPAGMYTFKAITNNSTLIRQFIKQ